VELRKGNSAARSSRKVTGLSPREMAGPPKS
jgi:hypothetical protein